MQNPKKEALLYVQENKHNELISLLRRKSETVNYRYINDSTLLHFATMLGHYECAKVLIEVGGADVDAVDKWGRTALHYAAIHFPNNSDLTLLLLGNKADQHAKDEYNNTPRKIANSKSHSDIILVYELYNGFGQMDISPEQLRFRSWVGEQHAARGRA